MLLDGNWLNLFRLLLTSKLLANIDWKWFNELSISLPKLAIPRKFLIRINTSNSFSKKIIFNPQSNFDYINNTILFLYFVSMRYAGFGEFTRFILSSSIWFHFYLFFVCTLRKKNIWIKEYFFDSNKWLSWMLTNKYFFRSKKYFYCL